MSQGPAAKALLAAALLDALPQTQCKRCGYEDCAAYAQAMAEGTAPVNQCAPGGTEGIRRLSAITGTAITPLNPDFGEEGPRTVAFIDEDWCIGCTLCIKACPVDAIVGANKRMHTVLEADCTGCELCLPVCPVDCILLENITGERTGWAAWSPEQAQQARARHAASLLRRQQEEEALQEKRIAKAELKLSDLAAHSQHTDTQVLEQKRRIIEAALERARALRAR